MSNWYVYMVLCEGGFLYTGVTTDPDRRFEEHRGSKKGASFFRIHKPLEMRVIEECENRSIAQKREAVIKKLSREQKENLFK